MSVATDLRDSLKRTVSGIINTAITKELFYPASDLKNYYSLNHNMKLTDPAPRVCKNGSLIYTGFTASNDSTTSQGKITFTVSQASSDRIEVSYNYVVYSDAEVDNFISDGCQKTGLLISGDPSSYVLADLVSTDPTPLIKAYSKIELLRDLLSRAYMLINQRIGHVSLSKREVFEHIERMIEKEEKSLSDMIRMVRMQLASGSPLEVITYLRYYEDFGSY